jgi:hypothetical protein
MLASNFGLSSHDNIIELKGHTLGLAITVENGGSVRAKWAVGVRVLCVVDGRPTPGLVTGVVGIGESREAALHNALETWVGEVGVALVPAIERCTRDHRSPKYDVYAGFAGIRGPTKPEHLDELNKRVFAVVEPALDQLVPTPSLHVLAFALVRKSDGSIDGEFRVDGEISDGLARLAHGVKWPEAAEDYMLKQYYVLAPHESK